MSLHVTQNSAVVNLDPNYMQNNQIAINPVINELAGENDLLMVAMFNTKKIFEEHKTAMQNTIATQAKTNEELQALLMQAENRIKEQAIMYEAIIKSNAEDQQIKKETIGNIVKEMTILIDFKEEPKQYPEFIPPYLNVGGMESLLNQSLQYVHDQKKNQDMVIANKEKGRRLELIKKLNDQLKPEIEKL